MDATTPFKEQLARYRAMVTPRLLAAIEGRAPEPYLYDLIGDHLSRAGKGFRPALCIATAAAFGADPQTAVPSAAALEMLHNAFLVHDDIEDDSDFRRTAPTMHVQHGIPLTVNVGDAMQALALHMLRDNLAVVGARKTLAIAYEFDHLLVESIEGQALELGWIHDNRCTLSEEDYFQMVLKKTCWYSFMHPCRIGGLIAGLDGSRLERFDRFGVLLGTAFQIQDDVLNLIGTPEKYGKEIGGDLWEGKRTLILVHLLRNLDPGENETLVRILRRTRRERSQDDVGWIYARLERHGSIEYARSAARELAAAAACAFEQAYAGTPDSADREFIAALLSYAVERDV